MAESLKGFCFWTQRLLSPPPLPIRKLAAAQALGLQNLCLGWMQGVQEPRLHWFFVSVECFGACVVGESTTAVSNPVMHLNAGVDIYEFIVIFIKLKIFKNSFASMMKMNADVLTAMTWVDGFFVNLSQKVLI